MNINRDLFKQHLVYTRNTLVAVSAKSSDIDFRKLEYIGEFCKFALIFVNKYLGICIGKIVKNIHLIL